MSQLPGHVALDHDTTLLYLGGETPIIAIRLDQPTLKVSQGSYWKNQSFYAMSKRTTTERGTSFGYAQIFESRLGPYPNDVRGVGSLNPKMILEFSLSGVLLRISGGMKESVKHTACPCDSVLTMVEATSTLKGDHALCVHSCSSYDNY